MTPCPIFLPTIADRFCSTSNKEVIPCRAASTVADWDAVRRDRPRVRWNGDERAIPDRFCSTSNKVVTSQMAAPPIAGCDRRPVPWRLRMAVLSWRKCLKAGVGSRHVRDGASRFPLRRDLGGLGRPLHSQPMDLCPVMAKPPGSPPSHPALSRSYMGTSTTACNT